MDYDVSLYEKNNVSQAMRMDRIRSSGGQGGS